MLAWLGDICSPERKQNKSDQCVWTIEFGRGTRQLFCLQQSRHCSLKSLQRKRALLLLLLDSSLQKFFYKYQIRVTKTLIFPVNRRTEKSFQWFYCQSSGDGLHEVPSKFRKTEHQSLPRLKKNGKDFFRMKQDIEGQWVHILSRGFLLGLGRLRCI